MTQASSLSRAGTPPATNRGTQAPRHFLDIDRLSPAELRHIVDLGRRLKTQALSMGERAGDRGAHNQMARGAVLAMIFDKPSTRTRVSFDIAMRQLGGDTVVLNSSEMQLGRGETITDTAQVLSRYVQAIMLRTGPHSNLLELAAAASVPVINGLTDDSHPCQILADILTFEEHRGEIAGRTLAWVGDGNNVATSMIHAAVKFGFRLRLACPPQLSPARSLLDWAAAEGGEVQLLHEPEQAVADADAVVTDTWISMGDKDAEQRMAWLRPYQVNAALMARAASDALFLHCLPAHRGEEVTAEVIDGPQSVVFDEAENRLHVQKAILAWCLHADGDD